MVLVLLPSGVAHGHGGIVPQPVVEVAPELEGLRVTGVVTVAPQLLVENTGPTPVTFLDDAGRPWLRISADGVEADLTVRAWWVANDPRGVGQDPPPDAPEGWTPVSDEPSFGWFPPALRPPTSPEQGHDWSLDVLVADDPAVVAGTLEEVEVQGGWTTRVDGDGDLGGAQLAAVSGTVPALVLQRGEADEVTVLGAEGEPMLRLRADGVAANLRSPTWQQHERWDTGRPDPTTAADAAAEPDWELLAPDGRTATWLEPRGATGRVVPATSAEAGEELPFEVTVVVDDEPVTVRLATSWQGEAPPGDRSRRLPLVAAAVAATLAAAGLGRRRRGGG